MSNDRRTPEFGFTLIEVLVAFAILSLGVGALLAILFPGFGRAAKDESQLQASALAQSLLAEIGQDIPLIDGERSGEMDNGQKWRIQIRPYSPHDVSSGSAIEAHTVQVSVWSGRDDDPFIVLDTIKLGMRN